MITKLPPAGFKILQISLQIMYHFLSRLCWPLLKVHFAGHAHVKLVLDVGMWITDWECGSPIGNVGHWLRIIHAPRRSRLDNKVDILMLTMFFKFRLREKSLNRLPISWCKVESESAPPTS